MPTTNYRARQGTSAYATGAITWDNATALSGETFTGNINEIKDITVTPPPLEYEHILCIGSVAQTVGANAQTIGTATGPTAGTFQNAAVQQTAAGMWKVSGTQVFTGDEQFVDVLALGNSQAITGGYTRWNIGTIATTGGMTRSTIGSFRLYLNNASEETSIVLSNVYVKIGEIRPTGADGHWERDFELVCLPKDGAFEWKD